MPVAIVEQRLLGVGSAGRLLLARHGTAMRAHQFALKVEFGEIAADRHLGNAEFGGDLRARHEAARPDHLGDARFADAAEQAFLVVSDRIGHVIHGAATPLWAGSNSVPRRGMLAMAGSGRRNAEWNDRPEQDVLLRTSGLYPLAA